MDENKFNHSSLTTSATTTTKRLPLKNNKYKNRKPKITLQTAVIVSNWILMTWLQTLMQVIGSSQHKSIKYWLETGHIRTEFKNSWWQFASVIKDTGCMVLLVKWLNITITKVSIQKKKHSLILHISLAMHSSHDRATSSSLKNTIKIKDTTYDLRLPTPDDFCSRILGSLLWSSKAAMEKVWLSTTKAPTKLSSWCLEKNHCLNWMHFKQISMSTKVFIAFRSPNAR